MGFLGAHVQGGDGTGLSLFQQTTQPPSLLLGLLPGLQGEGV